MKKKKKEKKEKQKVPLYVSITFIVLFVFGFLFMSIYYISFLPIPAEMQPYRIQILTMLNLDRILREDAGVIMVPASEAGVNVYRGPHTDSEIIGIITEGGFYEKTDQIEGWIEVNLRGEITRGWIRSEHIKIMGRN